jgi:hypothetical protein
MKIAKHDGENAREEKRRPHIRAEIPPAERVLGLPSGSPH